MRDLLVRRLEFRRRPQPATRICEFPEDDGKCEACNSHNERDDADDGCHFVWPGSPECKITPQLTCERVKLMQSELPQIARQVQRSVGGVLTGRSRYTLGFRCV